MARGPRPRWSFRATADAPRCSPASGCEFVIGNPISCSGGTCVLAGAYKTMADLEMGFLNWSPNLSGYQLVASDGGLFAFNAPFYGSMGGTAPQRAHRGHGRRPRLGRLLRGGLRRRHLRLQRPVLRLDGRPAPEQARGGHRLRHPDGRLLRGGLRRRHLRLQRPLLWLDGRPAL